MCTNGRASGKPACGPRGGDAVVAAVQRELLVRGLAEVLVTPCGCLGPCFDGPNAVVYGAGGGGAGGGDGLDGVWYAGLEPGDAAALVDHLGGGPPLAARRVRRPGSPNDDRDDRDDRDRDR